MQAKFQPSAVSPKESIPETQNIPLLGSYRGSYCFDCGEPFKSEAQGQLHAQSLDHAVLALFADYVN